MVNTPIRGIGKLGVITDIPPHDLPLEGWTDASNLRFADGSVSRYSVFKSFDFTYNYGSKQPTGIFEAGGQQNDSTVVTVFSDGTMEQSLSGVTTDVTPTGGLGSSTSQLTITDLGGLIYMNRQTDVPVYRKEPGDGLFQELTSWDSGDRCASFRTFKDFLVALNVTKGGVSYPGMVKWSDAAQSGQPPANWSVTDPASLAGENVLNDCDDALIDGATLGDAFIIFGETQTWRMDYIGEPFIFRTQMIFDDQGIMAPNCAVTVEGRQYVFGRSDIYVHDGLSKRSIANGRVLSRIMNEIDFDKAERCFLYHDQVMGEIGFCYPSKSSDAAWLVKDVPGCNRAWVYNYRSDTWSPVDMPSVVGATRAASVVEVSWTAPALTTWSQSGMSWQSLDSNAPPVTLLASTGHTGKSITGKPLFLDPLDNGQLEAPADLDTLWGAWGQMLYKDLDGLGVELYGRKMVRRLVPQFAASDDTMTIKMKIGEASGANTAIRWGRMVTMKPWNENRYDCRINNRYLNLQIEFPEGSSCRFGGYDADFLVIAQR